MKKISISKSASRMSFAFLTVFIGLFLLTDSWAVWAASGDVDLSFNAAITTQFGPTFINAIVVQPDGKILVGGFFDAVDGIDRQGLARLNADGSLDMTFTPPLVTPSVKAIALQADGKILVGGTFGIDINGLQPTRMIVRLNPDGSRDTSFNLVPSQTMDSVSSILVEPDGNILIGGRFFFITNTQTNGLARLNPNGSINNGLGFAATFNNSLAGILDIKAIALQPDGKIVTGGEFLTPNVPVVSNLARLNPNGTVDVGFNNSGANAPVDGLAVQPDGKILVAGAFNNVNGTTRARIARLGTDGSVDSAFAPAINGPEIRSLVLQTDGKILIGGVINTIAGQPRRNLARLNSDGSLDSFYPTGTPGGANGGILTIARQVDNKVLIGGEFTAVGVAVRPYVARLLDDITPPTVKPATSVVLSSSSNPSAESENVTFTATVSVVAPGTGTPSGIVHFFDDATLLGDGVLIGGTALFSTSTLAPGAHNITAVYDETALFLGSASAPLVQAVGALTPVGINVPVMLKVSGTTIRLIFSEVTHAGQTTALPGDPCNFIPTEPCVSGPGDPCRFVLPPGFIQDSNTVAYQINTTAIYAIPPDPIKPIRLSFQLTNFADPSAFNRLGVIHYTPVDPCHPQVLSTVRDFATKTLTAGTTSLSPFVITPTTDTTAPVTTHMFSQSPNANDWHRADVGVTLAATDEQGGTGVREITYGATGAQTINETTIAGAFAQLMVSAEGTTQITFSATDLAGNVEAARTITIRLDKTAPSVNINTPPNGASYLLNQPVSANYICTDSLSSIASCTGPVASGAALDTASVGGKSFSVNAADQAGNTASQTHSYTVTAAPQSPDRIVFESTRDGNAEIYSINADGSGQTRLTFNSAVDANPVLSPDRSRVAFTSFRNGNAEIYVMNGDGSNPTRLTNNAGIDDDAAWSPDGSRIVFWSSRDGNAEIYVMKADGTNQTRLTANSGTDIQASFSPDGRRIVFTSNRAAVLNFDIYVMNADGSGVTRLTTHAALDDSPSFSPDGTKIVFTSNRTGVLDFEIWVMNANGSNPVQLTSAANTSIQPSWSRDGNRIVFASNRNGVLNFEIYTMGAGGSAATRLTANAALDLAPSW